MTHLIVEILRGLLCDPSMEAQTLLSLLMDCSGSELLTALQLADNYLESRKED